jgi:hypothetical protein
VALSFDTSKVFFVKQDMLAVGILWSVLNEAFAILAAHILSQTLVWMTEFNSL